MKVLIVDDQASNRLVLKYLLESEGHECVEAEDGVQAVELFLEIAPDCILLDIVMPNMDGYEAAEKIKSQSSGYHVPIIFLTAKTDEESIIKCLESGGDDYLPKPVNQVMLMAKMRAHGRTQELTEQIRSKNDELTLLHETLRQEHEMGQHVLSHTLSRSWQDCPNIRSYLSSVSIFNGDLFLAARNPTGGFYAFLGDFTGHGLAAAIGAIPLSQVFFAMCAKGKAVMDIAESMNASLKAFLPEYMFCAATLIDINEKGDTFTVWSGGLPESLVIRDGEGVIDVIQSKHMPLGILERDQFDNEVQVLNLKCKDKVLLMTDGILEGMGKDGEMYGVERIKQSIAKGDKAYFDRVLDDYHEFSGEIGQQDDISIVEVELAPVREESESDYEKKQWLPWEVDIRLEAEQLQNISDPVNQIIKFLPEDMKFSRYADIIRTILAELFSNALEHGVLGLDSELKASPEGFMDYYQQRTERLNQLQEGFVDVRLNYDMRRDGGELLIVVADSGTGFDYQTQETQNMEDNTNEWGRGLALISSLCKRVTFDKGGSEITVEFELA